MRGPHVDHKLHTLQQEALSALEVLCSAKLVGPPQERYCLPHACWVRLPLVLSKGVQQRHAAGHRVDRLQQSACCLVLKRHLLKCL